MHSRPLHRVRATIATLAALLVGAASVQPAAAKVGFRQLVNLHPVAVQRGTERMVRLRCNFTLDNTYATFFDRPGIRMTYQETEPIEAPRDGRASVGTPFRFKVQVPDEQPTGIYEFRVATRQAVSSISHLLVTDFPVHEEVSAANDTAAEGQSVSLPAAICGVCERAEDVDYYRFDGVQGQRITAQVYSQRVTECIHIMLVRHPVYHLDSILTLISPSGQIVAENDNYFGADSLLHCELPETGEYVLKIRDVRYAGSEKHSYCIEVADRPLVQALFPLAVEAGTAVDAEPIGFGLADAPTTRLAPGSDHPTGWHPFRGQHAGSETNEIPVLVSPHRQFTFGEGCESLEAAGCISIPCGVNGRLRQPDAVQYFCFEAQQGQYYKFEVEAHRHGLPLDSVLNVYDTNGRRLEEVDDTRGSPYATRWYQKDSRLYFKAPASARYIVAVRDLNNRGGDRFVYHLRAELSGPDFELFGEYYYAMLAPGTRMLWFAKLNRLNGFDGPVELGVERLPDGVTCSPVTIPPGVDQAAMVLAAADDAAIDAALVRTFGKALVRDSTGESREIIRYGHVTCELQSGSGSSQVRWPCKTQLVGVTEPLDLARVEARPREITIAPGETAEIDIEVQRTPGNSDPVTLAMSHMYQTRSSGDQLPPGITVASGSRLQLKGDETAGKVVLQASEDALPVQQFSIAVMARVYVTYSISTNYASNPILLTVGPAAD